MKRKSIILALSGGGDRTFVLAGIVHYLKNKYNIYAATVISGSSYTVPIALSADSISSALSRINRFDILSFAKEVPSNQVLKKRGIFDIKPEMFNYIETLTGVKKGSTYKTKLIPIAVDISREDLPAVYLHNVRYGYAVRASMSLPYLLIPFKIKNMVLADGGLKGAYQTSIFKRFSGKVPIIALDIADPISTGVLLNSLRKSLFKISDDPLSKVLDLKALYNSDSVLRKVTKNIPNKSVGDIANFVFKIHGLGNYDLLLNTTDKKKLFLKGYFLGEQIQARLEYGFSMKTWKHFSNENTYDLDINKTVLDKRYLINDNQKVRK